MSATTITAGGITVGASSNRKASPKRATGLRKKNRASNSLFVTRTPTTCGFAFTPSMELPNTSSVATAGSAPTTLVQGKQFGNAGKPQPERVWITSPRINTKNSEPSSNPSSRTAPQQYLNLKCSVFATTWLVLQPKLSFTCPTDATQYIYPLSGAHRGHQ